MAQKGDKAIFNTIVRLAAKKGALIEVAWNGKAPVLEALAKKYNFKNSNQAK